MAKSESKKEKQSPNNPSEANPPSARNHPSLPYILDFAFTMSNLIVLLTGIITTLVSLGSGNSIITSVFHSGLAMLALGLVIWFLNYYLSKRVLETAAKDFNKAQGTQSSSDSTMEIHA